MAKMKITGLEDIQERFLRREKATTQAVPKMLIAGADILVKEQQETARQMFTKSKDRTTGETANSIKRTNVKGDETAKYIEVFPQGKNSRGERNATVGFVQQYGRSNMPASPYKTVANEKAAPEVQKAMLEVWKNEQSGN